MAIPLFQEKMKLLLLLTVHVVSSNCKPNDTQRFNPLSTTAIEAGRNRYIDPQNTFSHF